MACGGLPGSKFCHGRLARQNEQLLIEAIEQPAQRRDDQHEPMVAVELSIPAVVVRRHGNVLRSVTVLRARRNSLRQRLVLSFRRERQRDHPTRKIAHIAMAAYRSLSGEPSWPKTCVASAAEKKLPPAAAKRPRL